MVLRGAQIHRRGQAKCSLVSTRSHPHDLARLYDRALPFTSADLGGVAGPCLNEVQIWTDSHGPEIVLCDSVKTPRSAPAAQPVARCRRDFLCTQLLPWSSLCCSPGSSRCGLHAVRMTSLTMRRSRNRVPMNGIIGRRPKTCRYTYVFQMPDGGCHDL